MILFPPCKINLGLHILNKRADGFHNLDTLMYQLPFTDVLEIIPSDNFVFQSSGLEIPGDEINNLCVKVFELIRSQYDIPNVTIHLHKIIPMGGGLGGGSSNASAVLKGLNALFSLNLSTEKLQNLAAQLGSDCPLFIKENPQIAQGRGEILTDFEIDLSAYYLKLVNVGIHVSTKEAFTQVQFYDHFQSIVDIVSHPVERWKNLLKNDFENSVFEYHPTLLEVKQKLYNEGAIYASMSGSGSTMYAIYDIEPSLTFHQNSAVFEKIVKL
jgi:4-diphosphocytidyl-2-C-methyl-D-erythritol kinase